MIGGSHVARRRHRLIAVVYLAIAAAGVAGHLTAQTTRPVVYVVPIEGTIDLGLAPFLSRTIREAQQAGAAAVLLDINTFGGRVDAAVAMRDTLVNAPVRTIAFVNQRAISAGALIALATDTMVMADGGTIGAATPVVGGGAAHRRPRTKSRCPTCGRSSRPPRNAGIGPPNSPRRWWTPTWRSPGVVAKGKLLTLTTSEALEHKVAEFTADTLTDALEAAGLPDAEVRPATQTWAETLVRFLTNPIVSSLLMTIGMLGHAGRDPDAGLRGAGHDWLALARAVLLGPLDRPARGLGGAAAGRGRCAARRTRGLRHSRLRCRGHRRHRRARRPASGMTLVGAGATAAVIIGALGRVAISILLALAGGLALLRVLPTPALRPPPRARYGDAGRVGVRVAADRPIASRSVVPGPPCRRCGRQALRRSTACASMSSRTAASSRPAPPSKSHAWTATGSSSGRSTPQKRSRTHMTELESGAFGAIGLLVAAVLALIFVLYFVPVPLWIAAWSSGAPVGLFTLVGMRLRRVPPAIIVNARISAVKAGLEGVSINDLEAHYLAGGNVVRVVNALDLGRQGQYHHAVQARGGHRPRRS